jgi:beta-lactamase regulating signal transducer with metallopeptidase domain
MNAMEIFTAPLAQAIGWALLHLLWQATIVAGILAATLALLSRHSANTRYAVSCGALTLVFAMFVATAVRSYEPAPAPSAPTTSEEKLAPVTLVPVTRVPALLAAAATESWREQMVESIAGARQWLPGIVAIWLLGVVVLSSRLLLSWARTRRLASRATQETSAHWRWVARRLSDALGLKRAVRIIESAAVEVPSVIGSLRPVILLPASALTGMTPEQIEMVLAHELAHIRRHDFFVNLLQAMVETLMFYHPAVWWMSRRVRIERENCCDDLAVAVCGNPLQYARALTRLEELRAHAPAITVAANGGSLLDRIRRLVTDRAESTGSTSRWAAAVAMLSVVIIAIAVPSLPALADRDAKKKDQKTEAKREAKTESSTRIEVVEPAAEAEPGTPSPAPEAAAAAEAYAEDSGDIDIELPDDDEAAPAVAAVPVVAVTPRLAPRPMATPRPVASPRPPMPAAPVAVPMTMTAPVAEIAALAAADAMDHMWGGEGVDRDGKFGKSGKLTVDELIALRNAGVTPQYVQKMRALFPEVTLGQIVGLANMGVTTEYVANLRAAGVEIKTSADARKLAAMGVSSEFVKKLAAAGYSNLSVKELTRLAAAGVDEDFIREMSKYRDKN